MSAPKIVVIGLGYIGLPTAAMFALHGNEVLGVDIEPETLSELRSGNVPVREKDLTAIVRDALATGRLRVSDGVERADYFVLCVPTPAKGQNADLRAVRAAAKSIAPYIKKGSTVIVESTVPPGTTEHVVRPILENNRLRAGRDFHLAYCPERVMPGNIIREIVENDRIIGGITRQAAVKAREIYSSFVRGNIFLTDLTTSEFVKLAENAFRDVNIALANELADLAEAHGIDIWEAIGLANRHPRVNLLRPGPGVGGHCIAVDPWFLLTPKVEARMITSARAVNDARPGHVASRTLRLVKGIQHPKVAAFGVAYKGNADDIRESPAIRVIEILRMAGVDVATYDPLVPHDLYPTQGLEETISGADCLLILADHRDFFYVDPGLIARRVRRKVLFDTRHCVDHGKWAKRGFEVYDLGSSRVLTHKTTTPTSGEVTASP